MRYKGWVPTVNGRLSFRVIGETNHPTDATYGNEVIGRHRFVIAIQQRPTSDALFAPIGPWFLGFEDIGVFVAVARELESSILTDAPLIGRVFWFKDRRSWRQSAFDETDRCARCLHPHNAKASESAISEGSMRELYAVLLRTLNAHSDLAATFRLARDGVVTFARPDFTDSTVKEASEQLASTVGDDFETRIVDQMFFFLRDLAHQHQHHDPNSDTITTLQKDEGSGSWPRHIIFSLYHNIIQHKRSRETGQHANALGLLAYTKSFKSILAIRAKREGWIEPIIPMFNDESLRDSIAARKDLEQVRFERDVQQRSQNITLNFAILSFLAAAIGLPIAFKADGLTADPVMSCVSSTLYQHFSNWVALGILIFIATWVLKNLSRFSANRWLRDYIRVAFYFGQGFGVLLSFATGAALLLAAFWVSTYIVSTPEKITGIFPSTVVELWRCATTK